MKKITLSLLVASSLLFGFHSDTEKTDQETYVSNQTIVNEVVASPEKVEFANSGKQFGVGAQMISAGDVKIFNIPVGVNIGSNFGLEANVPILRVRNTFTEEDNIGLGDITLGGNFHFGKYSDIIGNNITTLLYKTVTGDENEGFGTIYKALTISQRTTKYIDNKYQLHGLLSYTRNGDSNDYGDSYMLMAGGAMPCLISDKVTTNMKITYFHVNSVESFGVTAGEIKSTDLWFAWNSSKLINDVPLGFGVKIPLVNELDGVDKDKTVLFYLTVSSFFK